MITVTGSLAFDHIMDFEGKFSDHIMPDKIHQINLSFLVNTLQKQKGGTAGNIAYNLALLRTPVSIVGAVGADFEQYRKFLEEAGVDVAGIKTVDDSTSSAFIMTDLSDNQIAGFYPGAMRQNSQLTISPSRSQSPPGRWPDFVVISPNDPAAMVTFTKQCQEKKIPYLMDPGMQLPALEVEDLKTMVNGAEILIGNDYEISLLSEKLKVQSSKFLEKVRILITTLGEKGSIIQTGTGPPSRWEIKPAKPVKVVDPTGAGDAYRAGFLAGYLRKFDLKVCGQMGSVASCYAVEKYGTTNHKFSVEEFCTRYQENFGEELQLSSLRGA